MSERPDLRCGARATPGGVRWRVWAPHRRNVDLVLIDGDRRRSVPMDADGDYFLADVADARPGQRYLYRLDGGDERPDPASRWQPDGVHGPSAVPADDFAWRDGRWRGVPREDLVLYELHVGTFTPEGTFDAAVPRLAELRDLGVTAVELMPVAQFPGGRNWGYDGTYPFAAQNTYGGPDGLRRLVDACHAAGLGAVLDVVYNHLGPEGCYVREFGPYFTNHYRTPWGDAVNYDGPDSDAVRDFVLENVRHWLEDFHFDGLRLDAVHAIYDLGPRHLLREIQEAAEGVAARRGWPAHVIAESDLNDPRVLLPPERGGYGLDAQWSDDFHHAVHALLTGERQGYYRGCGEPADVADVLREPFLRPGVYSPHRRRKHGGSAAGLPGDRFVVCIQNHDQVGNRATGDRLEAIVDAPRRRLAASLLLLSPHLPLIFMGEEYGETNPFPFFCSFGDPQLVEAVRKGRREEFAAFAWQGEVPDPQAEATFRSAVLGWRWDEPARAGLRRLYADLLAARRGWPGLREFSDRATRLIDGRVVELARGPLRAYFNLSDRPAPLPPGPVCFSSESPRYGGRRADGTAELLPFECVAVTDGPH